jgi:ABC-type uncharacterized transport system permease subunit
MERAALIGSSLCYLFALGHTLFYLFRGRFRPGRFNVAAMAGGAALQGWYLTLLGSTLHACPIRTLPQVFVFLGWSMALFYLAIGPSYRLSLMGAFTAPVILIFQLAAVLLPSLPVTPVLGVDPWIETHASLSLLAYGALGLACISGLMYLVQEDQLKSRRPAAIFHDLPPIATLAVTVRRLLVVGFVLLSVGFAAGFLAHSPIPKVKICFSALIWLLYAGLIADSLSGRLGNRRTAQGAMLVFLLALLLLPVIQRLSTLG